MSGTVPKIRPFQTLESPAVILASASTTRRALLAAAGLSFEVRPAAIDEDSIKQSSRAEGISPMETAQVLAELKAARIKAPGALIIGADQILTCDERWFDKPRTREQAIEQLRFLRGKTHVLHTALTCICNGSVIWHHNEAPLLKMREFSEEFLKIYLDQELPGILASVGAYRLEGAGAQLFERMTGDHSTVLGLPLLPLLGFLRQHGALMK